MMPPMDTIGEIKVSGQDLRFIRIVNDTANTGGFLIFRANNGYMYGAYDDWVENEIALQRYVAEFSHAIEWEGK